MGIQDIVFTGLIQNRKLSEITGPEFFNALMACGWKEGTGTHFFQQLRKDGPSRGISTPAELVRAVSSGTSEPGRDGTTIHRICSRSAYIVFNATTRTLITFSQGNPPQGWDIEKAIQHLRTKAGPPYGVGKCATFVREAIEAGGLAISRSGSGSAKDYGPRLVQARFVAQLGQGAPYQKGDVAVIDGFLKSAAEGIKKDHVDGHLAMYDGTQWISDFKQTGNTPYPGSDYEKAKPKVVIYRYNT
ncbi:MAG: hypothetical protein DWI21_18365 [Planctomycetota bacterium]|nr:MAG: hypothetical protein DWI21_18365 [Planctomycetota bacterium]